ncbi:MAG: nucleotidyltransferase [Deltaproteobacteria bacterium]|nr:MAG: nucleotidyltransferase [Deltaproteobacteria bacterium]
MTQDIRWLQRFNNYQSALAQLQKFIDKGDLTDLEQQGLIKAFEYTFELAWKTLRNYLEYQGEQDIFGSRDCIRKAFQAGIIRDGQIWMDMLASRNKTSHTYNQETADEITRAILTAYHPVFLSFRDRMLELAEKQGADR